MGYNYSVSDVRSRVSSGKDKNRAATVDKLAAQATQPPHEDDAAAMAQLTKLSGNDAEGGWATPDARNYTRMVLSGITGQQPDYMKEGDGGGFLHSLGSVLKVAAPLAGMLIPGVGPLGAAAIGAGGSAAGGALEGDKFDLLKTIGAGGAAALGNKALGNGLGSVAPTGIVPGVAPLSPQGIMAPGGGVMNAAAAPGGGGGGGILDKVLGAFKTPSGGIDLNKVLSTVGMVGGGIQAAHTQDQANQQRQGAIEGATGEWNARAPLRSAAMEGILKLPTLQRPDLSQLFADTSNPYYRRLAPLSVGN